MRWCWNRSLHIKVEDDDATQLYANNSCDRHQLSLMAWLYDGAVGKRLATLSSLTACPHQNTRSIFQRRLAPSVMLLTIFQLTLQRMTTELKMGCARKRCNSFDFHKQNKNSSGDEIANVNFLRRYGTYVLQNTKKENLLRLTN